MYKRENKALVGRLYEQVVNARQPDRATEFIAPDVEAHGDFPGTEGFEGLEAYKRSLSTMLDAFPDYHETVEEEIAEEDKVMVRFTATGTHHGQLMDLPPTGTAVRVQGIDIFRIDNGKIAEHRRYLDAARLMRQLLGFPLPDRAPQGPDVGLRKEHSS